MGRNGSKVVLSFCGIWAISNVLLFLVRGKEVLGCSFLRSV